MPNTLVKTHLKLRSIKSKHLSHSSIKRNSFAATDVVPAWKPGLTRLQKKLRQLAGTRSISKELIAERRYER